MIIPAVKPLKMIAGTDFDFRFQYLSGNQASNVPVDLTSFSATWIITSLDGNTVYQTYYSDKASLYPTIQTYPTTNLFPVHGPGIVLPGSTLFPSPSSFPLRGSGVYFGGDNRDPTNGIIDLTIVAGDTASFTWQEASYWLTLYQASEQITILRGFINILANLSAFISLPNVT